LIDESLKNRIFKNMNWKSFIKTKIPEIMQKYLIQFSLKTLYIRQKRENIVNETYILIPWFIAIND
jgi:hypothetical protein